MANSSAHGLHRRAQKASTLMRGALKKPGGSFSDRIQHLTPGTNPQRELRAKNVSKHSRVEHFGHPKAAGKPQASRPQAIQGEVMDRSPRPHPTSQNASQAVALPSMVASASHQKLERMLDAALTHADAHKQALRYQAARHFWQRPGFLGRRPALKIILALLIIVLATGLVAWRKLPVLSIKIAGARAHISASVPAYRPTGYSLASPASAKNGAVLLKYESGNGAQGYDISQKSSNMTSTSLAQTVVPPGAQVQTTQVGGNTIYIYGGGNNAAWVNNGILYTINDHARLTSDEIIKIVQGLN